MSWTQHAHIQVRRDTAANWTAANPTLLAGELGWESDTGTLKVGDGATDWVTLIPFTAGSGDLLAANNLSDVASVVTSRNNLGLGSLATQSGTFSGTAILDMVTATPGSLLVRGAFAWQALPGGTLNYVLTSTGPSNVPTWQVGGGGGGGSVATDAIWTAADRLALSTGASAAVEATLTTVLDTISSTTGAVMVRGAFAWQVVVPGTSGHVFTSNGVGAVPTYQAVPAGVGDILSDPAWTVPAQQVVGTGAGTAAIVSGAADGSIWHCDSAAPEGLAWFPIGSHLQALITDTGAPSRLAWASVQPLNASLTSISGITVSAYALTLLDDVNAAAAQTTLGLASMATQAASAVAITGGAITGTTIDGVSIKSYVDNLVTGLKWKQTVIAATTVAGTFATSFENGKFIDGVTLTTGDRLLIKDQASAAENGIYIVAASGAPTRSTDADTGIELVGATVVVEQGTVNADKAFVCTNNTITLGVTAIVFVNFVSAISGALLAANNLSDVQNASVARTNLGLVIGTNVQAFDADLSALAGLTSAANKGIQYTGSGTAATYDLTAAGKALLDDADAAAQLATLGAHDFVMARIGFGGM